MSALKKLGLTVPPTLIATADEVIERDLSDSSSCRSNDLQFLCRCLAFVEYLFVLNSLALIEPL
jgi:hypothetical protein